jgi:hypothetical protein
MALVSLIAAAAGSKAVTRQSLISMPQHFRSPRLIEDATKDPHAHGSLCLAKGQTPATTRSPTVSRSKRLPLCGGLRRCQTLRDEPEPTAEEALVTPTTGPTAAQMLATKLSVSQAYLAADHLARGCQGLRHHPRLGLQKLVDHRPRARAGQCSSPCSQRIRSARCSISPGNTAPPV